ncbi:class I SAM-dependent methyltransferase, partial [Clostridium sp. AF24-2LB]
KKLNNGLPILHKVPPKRDYGRYFCIMAEKGGTSHGGLTEKLSPFFHAKKQEVNAYGR